MAVDKAFDYLDAPVTRLPYNDRLDLEVIPLPRVHREGSPRCWFELAAHSPAR